MKKKIDGGRKLKNSIRETEVEELLNKGQTRKQILNTKKYGYKIVKKVWQKLNGTRQEHLNNKWNKVRKSIVQGLKYKEIEDKFHCGYAKISEIKKSIAENQGNKSVRESCK